ncbi:hypothetical protein MHU86_7333 [Fragilaria crotonensis]|nr:hypothetical protein MHU86_7333 [Fragilaria crotonensis]
MIRFAPGTRTGTFISFHSVLLSSFRTIVSQHRRCFQAYGRFNVFPSFALEATGSFSLERTARLQFTVLNESRQFHATSIRDSDDQTTTFKPPKESEMKPDGNAKTRAISINSTIIALGRDGRWRDIMSLYHKEQNAFNAVNCSTVMSQLARIRKMQKDDPSFQRFLAVVAENIHEDGIRWLGGVRQLSTIVHALAKMGLAPQHNSSAEQIMTFLAQSETVEWMFDKGSPQNVTNCVWACGKLGVETPNLFKSLDERVEWVFFDGSTQDIANCAWACGTLGIEAPNLFRMIDERAEWLFENGNSQVVANCIWACGKLGIRAPKLFELLDDAAEWLFDEGTPQEIANCVMACAKLGIKAPKLFLLLDQRSQWFVRNGTPQGIGICVWACEQLGIKAPKLFIARRSR